MKFLVSAIAISALAPGLMFSAAYASGGYTWQNSSSNVDSAYCNGMAASSNTGQYEVCGADGAGIYTSSDYGATWNYQSTTGSTTWSAVGASATGQFMAAVPYSGDISLSTNYGATWTDQGSSTNQSWSSIAVSSNGQTIVAAPETGNIYITTNGGTNWTADPISGSTHITQVGISSNGQYITAADQNGYIYVSANSGSTWTHDSSTALGWQSLYESPSGQYAVASNTSNEKIYVTTNYGVNWTGLNAHTGSTFWGVIISSNGKTILAEDGANSGYIYESFDGGQTWSQDSGFTANNGFFEVVGSADMSKLTVEANNGIVYYGADPALFIAPPSNNVTTTTTTTTASAISTSPDTGYGMPNKAKDLIIPASAIAGCISISFGLLLLNNRRQHISRLFH